MYGNANVGRPRDDVAVSVYPPDELPTSIFPNDGAVERPVPPYITPTDVVADTTPLLACRGPFRVEIVRPPLNVFVPTNVLFVYALGIVVDECIYELIELFSEVESTASAPPDIVRPEPVRSLNDSPLITRLVVDAVSNDEYAVDDEYANVILPVESIVVVPVPPKYAVYADSRDDVAFRNLFRPEK